MQDPTAIFERIVAIPHIHFLGHYIFRDNKHLIDLEAMLANVAME
jgi:hypothetical protein